MYEVSFGLHFHKLHGANSLVWIALYMQLRKNGRWNHRLEPVQLRIKAF